MRPRAILVCLDNVEGETKISRVQLEYNETDPAFKKHRVQGVSSLESGIGSDFYLDLGSRGVCVSIDDVEDAIKINRVRNRSKLLAFKTHEVGSVDCEVDSDF